MKLLFEIAQTTLLKIPLVALTSFESSHDGFASFWRHLSWVRCTSQLDLVFVFPLLADCQAPSGEIIGPESQPKLASDVIRPAVVLSPFLAYLFLGSL